MNEKRSIQDLIDLLADKHGLSKKEAEAVVKGMFDLIEEALDREKYVKVKGLGTFKLTEVERRESVDVNTGERIEIQGHNKVSFTPDTSMKDLINKPFAHFETVILNEGTQLEDTVTETEEELAEEIRTENDADTLENEGAAPSLIPTPTDPVSTDVSNASEQFLPEVGVDAQAVNMREGGSSSDLPPTADRVREVSDQDPVMKRSETEVASLTIVARKVEITSEKVTTNCMMMDDPVSPQKVSECRTDVSLQQREEQATSQSIDKPVANELAFYRRWVIILTVLLVLSLMVGGYLFFKGNSASLSLTQPVQKASDVEKLERAAVGENKAVMPAGESVSLEVANQGTEDSFKTEETVDSMASILESSTTVQYETPFDRPATVKDTLEYEITGTLTKHTLKEGESLIKISLKYFGNKEMWPYIVSYNSDVIRDANRVPVGTHLRIPKLTPRQ